MRILVTGVAGFIGFHVSKYLLHRGDQVILVDNINNCYDTKLKEVSLLELEKDVSGDSGQKTGRSRHAGAGRRATLGIR